MKQSLQIELRKIDDQLDKETVACVLMVRFEREGREENQE